MSLNKFNSLFNVTGELRIVELENEILAVYRTLVYNYFPPTLLSSGPVPGGYICSIAEQWGSYLFESEVKPTRQEAFIDVLVTYSDKFKQIVESVYVN